MPILLDETLTRGGKPLVDLLQFAIYSVQLEPLFLTLVQDYRTLASIPRALALFDTFCAMNAPGRIQAREVLPPLHLRLELDIRLLRTSSERSLEPPPDTDDRSPPPGPPRYLFDLVVTHLLQQHQGPLVRIASGFDPSRSPHENLPGGRMNEAQRSFVQNVWQPRIRPRLVASGFSRVAALGG